MTLNFKYIGWCQEDTSDKVWGVIYLENPKTSGKNWDWCSGVNCVAFWGRRGKKLQTRMCHDDWELEKVIRKKQQTYVKIDTAHLDQVYPEFANDLEKTALWSMLKI